MIRTEGVHKSFGDLHVLRGVDFNVEKGEVVVLIGPSGSGKSTLLRCINLLVQPDAGSVFLDGVQVNTREIRPEWVRRQVGMVFQSFNLFSHLTALDNVTLGPRKVVKVPAQNQLRRALSSSNTWASQIRQTPTPPNSPGDSNSGLPLPGLWR